MSPYRHFHRIAWLAVLFSVAVILLGGFTRLSNAGLSCPDWPTCYGRAAWPNQADEIDQANADYERAVEPQKAMLEQLHRHLAATLGLITLLLALIAVHKRRAGLATVLLGTLLIGASIPVYMYGPHQWSALLATIGQLILLSGVVRWSNEDLAGLATFILVVIVCQALLGMWTVIWLVKPIIVMSHLLGGLTTFSLLLVMAWWATPNAIIRHADAPKLRQWLWFGLAILIGQIALGGWTSANYAALSCGMDFPKCAGQWWPATNFGEAFTLWRGIGVDYEGGVLDGEARAAIQLSHRLFAIIVTIFFLALFYKLIRTPGLRVYAVTLIIALIAQIALGISNVIYGLPLAVATAHLGFAALMLFVIVSLLARLQPIE